MSGLSWDQVQSRLKIKKDLALTNKELKALKIQVGTLELKKSAPANKS